MADVGYSGPAVLTVDGRDLPVQVQLDARHEPHDGRLHWFGRVTLKTGPVPGLSSGRVELSTAGGRAEAKVGEPDVWGRYRVTGVGAPPFAREDPELRSQQGGLPPIQSEEGHHAAVL